MKFPSYERYRKSGVEWLGDIPEHWELKRLKFLVNCFGGGTPSKANGEYWTGDIPWVSPKDMSGQVVTDTVDHITEDAVQESATKLIESGAVLVVVRSGILRHTIPVAINIPRVALNQDMKALVPRSHLRSDFLKYFIQGLNKSLLNIWSKMGCTVESIESDSMLNSLFPVPPLPEQTAIAAFLDRQTARIDTLIGKKRRFIALLREKRAALITRAVTRGLNPDAPLKDSGVEWLGLVPAHWEVKQLKYIGKIGNGSTPSRDNPDYWVDGTFPWLNSSVVNRESVMYADEFVTATALAKCHLPRIKPPAVLVGITGQGKTRGMASTLQIEATINQHMAFIKLQENIAEVEYIRRVFDRAYSFLRNESDGGGSTKGAITCEQISTLVVPVPPLAEQQKIISYLGQKLTGLDALRAKVNAAIGTLKEYRAAVITAAVTGKIDATSGVGVLSVHPNLQKPKPAHS